MAQFLGVSGSFYNDGASSVNGEVAFDEISLVFYLLLFFASLGQAKLLMVFRMASMIIYILAK